MNTLIAYLEQNWNTLGLSDIGSPDRLACVIGTPRFRTSSHVLFFVLAESRRQPVLVAKVPRLAGDSSQLDKEAHNLRRVQALRERGFESIPKLIAYEDFFGNRLLIETAVEGLPLRPNRVRRYTTESICAPMNWLSELHEASIQSADRGSEWLSVTIESSLSVLDGVFAGHEDEAALIESTRGIVESLSREKVPFVFEHGDFGAPNILRGTDGKIGVVDWELAEFPGIPAVDSFFFLNFVAFSRTRARSNAEYLSAFREAFFGPDPWTQEWLSRYCARIGLDRNLLKPLFFICWVRCLANVAKRLQPEMGNRTRLGEQTVAWLRENRYYQLWKHALENENEVSAFT